MSAEEGEKLRNMAIRMAHDGERKKKLNQEESCERSIIIIGSKGVGKTTMVNKFLEKDETPKPTTAMDYSFGRKAGKSLVNSYECSTLLLCTRVLYCWTFLSQESHDMRLRYCSAVHVSKPENSFSKRFTTGFC